MVSSHIKTAENKGKNKWQTSPISYITRSLYKAYKNNIPHSNAELKMRKCQSVQQLHNV